MAKEKKAREPKARTLLVVRYTATDKKAEHLMDEEKKSYAALAYRAIKVHPGCTFDDIWKEIYRTVSGRTEGKTPKNSVHAILHHFVKGGLVKRSEKREKAEAAKTVAA